MDGEVATRRRQCWCPGMKVHVLLEVLQVQCKPIIISHGGELTTEQQNSILQESLGAIMMGIQRHSTEKWIREDIAEAHSESVRPLLNS